ncbi:hypothetical protein ACHAW5_001926 [Stephanodiscus triporus]|uniref:Ribosomal RNA-processing protein 42 n=1 Tax=Stephanodiscus triporus TaxID=2934178 RepID=A0ABD3NPL2_9STRA
MVSSSEASYIIESCLDDFRIDGRSRSEYRVDRRRICPGRTAAAEANDTTTTTTTTGGPLVLSNGSSRVHLPGSSTDVLCSVKADLVRPSSSRPNAGVCELCVDLSLSRRTVATTGGGRRGGAARGRVGIIVAPHAPRFAARGGPSRSRRLARTVRLATVDRRRGDTRGRVRPRRVLVATRAALINARPRGSCPSSTGCGRLLGRRRRRRQLRRWWHDGDDDRIRRAVPRRRREGGKADRRPSTTSKEEEEERGGENGREGRRKQRRDEDDDIGIDDDAILLLPDLDAKFKSCGRDFQIKEDG